MKFYKITKIKIIIFLSLLFIALYFFIYTQEPNISKINSYFKLGFDSKQSSIDVVVKKLREDIKNTSSLNSKDTRIYIFKYGPNHLESEVQSLNQDTAILQSERLKKFVKSKYPAISFKEDQLIKYKNKDKVFLLMVLFLTSGIFLGFSKHVLFKQFSLLIIPAAILRYF